MLNMIWTALFVVACGGPSGPTVEDLNKAKAEATPMRSWSEFEAALPAGIGDPVVDGDTTTWAAKDGDKCKLLKVSRMGEMIGSASISDGDCP